MRPACGVCSRRCSRAWWIIKDAVADGVAPDKVADGLKEAIGTTPTGWSNTKADQQLPMDQAA